MGCLGSKTAVVKSGILRSADANDSEYNTSNHVSKTAVTRKKKPDAGGASLVVAVSSPSAITSPRTNVLEDQQAILHLFLRSVLESTERFLHHLPDSISLKEVMAISFMNSCTEVARTKIRMKSDLIIDVLEQYTANAKLTLLHSAVPHIQERNMDETFSRILLAWFSNNPGHERRVTSDVCQAILETLHVRYIASKPAKFEDVLDFYFRWISVNQAALEVYDKFTNSGECMTMEQYGKFLRDTQQIEVSDRQIAESFKYRYGGGIHRYNFVAHNSGVLTNNAIDPSHTSDVWQDMTQSFTRYFVSCARVDCEADVHRALAEGVRAFVLNIHQHSAQHDDPSSTALYSGTCPLELVLQTIRQNGFTTNTYPIVLCLSPNAAMSSEVQSSVAAMLTTILGPMLAKGLMFEGGDVNDPKFSPGALRKKVLVMGCQSKLRPFIGFLVANMNKDGLGVRVTDVVEGTPAAKSGVLKDDWLTHFNGEPIYNKNHLRQMLDGLEVGDEFTLKRENLDELKVIVGSVVDSNDHSVSSALSDIVFFKYVPTNDTTINNNGNNNSNHVDSRHCVSSNHVDARSRVLTVADPSSEAKVTSVVNNASKDVVDNHNSRHGHGASTGHQHNHRRHNHSHHSSSDANSTKTGTVNGAASSVAGASHRQGHEKEPVLHAGSIGAVASATSPTQADLARDASSGDRVSELRVWDTQRLDMRDLLVTRLTRDVLNTHFVIVSINAPDTKSYATEDKALADSAAEAATGKSAPHKDDDDTNNKDNNNSSSSSNATTSNQSAMSIETGTQCSKNVTDASSTASANNSTSIAVSGRNGGGSDAKVDYEGIASRIGVQFIDIPNTERSLAWARGRFSENGRCGYMLKSNLDPERRLDLTITIICGPRVLDCLPITRIRVTLCGDGTGRTSGNSVMLTGCDESTVAILNIDIMVNGFMHVLTASFCPLLLRAGYRALPCVQAADERSLRKVVHSVYCFIKKA